MKQDQSLSSEKLITSIEDMEFPQMHDHIHAKDRNKHKNHVR